MDRDAHRPVLVLVALIALLPSGSIRTAPQSEQLAAADKVRTPGLSL